MSTIKNGGLGHYGTEPFEQQQYGTAGVDGIKVLKQVRHTVVALVLLHYFHCLPKIMTMCYFEFVRGTYKLPLLSFRTRCMYSYIVYYIGVAVDLIPREFCECYIVWKQHH